jgi:hypothetical protein
MFKRFQAEARLNYIKEFSPYCRENTFPRYKDQQINAVQETDRCLHWESNETHKYKIKS